MSGGSRQTGTVPKTKHNTRPRRENHVNHIPNNLDWHEPYPSQRVRKESNTSASRMSDTGEDYEENPWLGLPPPARSEGEELRWANVKTSNLVPERSSSLTSVDGLVSSPLLPTSRVAIHRQQENNTVHEEPLSSAKEAEKLRLKQKIELSKRQLDELQQQQAAYLSLRSKAIQQVKPVRVEEIHQGQPLTPLRNKAIQQVKPVQQGDMDQVNNLERRLQNIQELTNIMQAIERDDSMSVNFEGNDNQVEQQLRHTLQELLEKKARMDNLLAYYESSKDRIEGTRSVSSEEGDSGAYFRAQIMENTESSKRGKQDNRDQISGYASQRESKLEDLRLKLDQLQGWINRMENQRGPKSSPRCVFRMNGDGASSQLVDTPQPKSHQSPRDKGLHPKKLTLDNHQNVKRAPKSRVNGFGLSQSNVECWSLPTQRSTPINSVHFSSDEGEYDESPVKLCAPELPGHSFNKANFGMGMENSFSAPPSFSDKCVTHHPGVKSCGGEPVSAGRSECDGGGGERQATPRQGTPQVPPDAPPDQSLMALLSQIQLQLDHVQSMYHGLVDKQPHPPWLPPSAGPPPYGLMQFMSPSSQWHQHQLLISSLNQCCQLIWHQQREIAGLRQALSMLQEGERGFKCDEVCEGYGRNLNPGLLWQPPLNNQVPPGNRANNYWDNFRSYSRQNLLSARNKTNEGHRSTLQNENLRRVENNPSSNTHSRLRGAGEVLRDPNRCGTRELSMNKIKHEHGNDAFSLEQSVYSELESVIVEEDRGPDLLLQLLSQLKSLKSQQCLPPLPLHSLQPPAAHHDEGELEEASGGMDAGQADCEAGLGCVPSCSRGLPDHKPLTNTKMSENVLEGVSRLVSGQTGYEVCSLELLQAVLDQTAASLHLPLDSDLLATIESSITKFHGSRLSQVAEDILCSVANILALHYPVELNYQEEEEEEGAVGGVMVPPAPTSHHHHHHQTQTSSPQSVETELAEADQRSGSDNAQMFDAAESGAFNGEDSQEQNRDCSGLSSSEASNHPS